MANPKAAELERLNAQIVGHLLAQRSPPRDLIARRDLLRGSLDGKGPAGPEDRSGYPRRRLPFRV